MRYAARHKIRVITAASLFDGHDAAIGVMRRVLQAAGAEVIHLGHNRGAEEVVDAAIQEDVDVIGVSILSGAHMTVFPRILDRLAAREAGDILVVGGGVIPDEDVARLKSLGVAEILLQDTPPEAIVAMVRRVVAERGPR
jgi:methylmalonyl-CoA mutase C-terminal domain/subunit